MAKKNTPVEENNQTSLENFNDKLTSMSLAVKKNQKKLLWICILAAVVIAGLLYYFTSVKPKAELRRHEAIGVADREASVGNDSVAIDIYRQVAAEGGQAGNRAKLDAAILLYNKGEYQQALDLVSDYSPKDELIGAAAYSLKGDCLVNLDQFDAAADAFKKAIKQSGKNPYYTPFFMEKLARVYDAQGKYTDEVKLYEEILADYPVYNDAYQGVNIEKQLNVARAKAGK